MKNPKRNLNLTARESGCSLPAASRCADAMTSQEFSSWLEAYGRAWETKDPVAASALFAEDAAYHELPFADPGIGRAAIRQYWEAATRNQSDIKFCSEVVAVADGQGIAHWSAEFTRSPSAVRMRLDGVFVLEFDKHGLCRKLREWWHRIELPQCRQAASESEPGSR